MRPGEVLLEYVLDDPASFCVSMSRKGAHVQVLPAGRKEIEKLFPSDMTGRINTLVTHLAATQLVLAFESINKLIWGTQLDLLLHVNSSFNGVAVDELNVFYEKAATAHQTGLKDYPFEKYLGFLINSGLLIRTNDRVYITPFAKEFLAHLARSGATYLRPL